MPLYEYQCEQCGTRFEELTTFEKSTLVVCQNCGSSDIKKLMSVFSTISQHSSQSGCEKSQSCREPNCPYSQN